jgi:adenosyl cobinamide kinase/adenosyl cobinamide phosphate guanylyltransferase
VITLVLGGARSGKSEVAERLASSAGGGDVVYVATALVEPADDDMVARVDAHRARRPPSWRTVECGAALVDAIRDAPDGTMLVDSLGTWLAAAAPTVDVDVGALCDALAARRGDTVIVSDEVGLGVHPSSEGGRRFRDALGTCNRSIADISGRVLLVVAGRVFPLEKVE